MHLSLFNDVYDFTDMFQYIIYYRPEEILGLIQYQWPIIKEKISSHPEIKDKIANIAVPCSGRPELYPLSRTYLPLPELQARFSQYGEHTDDFRFLDLDNTLAPNDLSSWTFLHDYFGVGNSDTLSFYLDVLAVINCDKPVEPRKVFDLYQIIYGKVISSDDVAIGRDLVRSVISHKLVVESQLSVFQILFRRSCASDASYRRGHKMGAL